jgi:hypothetical protein
MILEDPGARKHFQFPNTYFLIYKHIGKGMRTNEWTLFLFLRGETIAEESRGGGA